MPDSVRRLVCFRSPKALLALFFVALSLAVPALGQQAAIQLPAARTMLQRVAAKRE